MTPEYIPDFVSNPNSKFEALRALDWEDRAGVRLEYYCNDFNKPYTYGRGRGERTYLPRPYPEEVLEIRRSLEANFGCTLEVCFLNLYQGQRDHLGWHSDDSPEMDPLRPIISVSLGAEREIWTRRIGEKEITKTLLGHGSAFIMPPGFQQTHQHRIPKAGFACGERISLTFRGYR